MTGLVCLQGGGEFSPGCRPMDAEVLRRVSAGRAVPVVRVVVVALAGAPGREHDTAAANGVAHYRGLGADAVAAPDARTDPAGAVGAVASADLVVLPGGSPFRLLSALLETPVGAELARRVEQGVAVSGSSAGAMVLGGWTVLPERRSPAGPEVAPALALVPDVVVVPHWSGGRADWLGAVESAVPAGTTVLGLPEESGVLLEGGRATALGRADSAVIGAGTRLVRGTTVALPGPG